MSLPWATWLDELGWNIRDSLWDRKSFCGVPFLANPAARVLYPPDLFFRLLTPLSPAACFNGLILFHFLALGIGGAVWAGRYSRHPFVANLGGWIWMLNGYLLSRIGLADPAFLFAMAWIPWLMFCLEGIEKRWSWVGLWVFGVLEVLAGRPDVTLYAVYALAGWTALVWVPRFLRRSSRERALAAFGKLITAGVLVGLTCAVQVLPTLEFQSLSINRSGKIPFQFYLNDSLRPVYALLSLFPGSLGDPTDSNRDTLVGMPGTYWGVGAGYHEIYAYLGQGTLLLALLGVVLGRTRARWYWLTIAVISCLLSLGGFLPGYRWVFEWAPGWDGFRVPPRVLVLLTPAAACLAVTGLDALLRRLGSSKRVGRRDLTAPVAATGVMLVVWVGALSLAYTSESVVESIYETAYNLETASLTPRDWEILDARGEAMSRAVQIGVLLGVGSCVLVLLAVRYPGAPARRVLLGLAFLIAVDLAGTHQNYLRGVTLDDIGAAYRTDPILDRFREEFPEGRLLVAGNVMNFEKRQVHPYFFPGRLFMYDFENVGGYGPFLLDHFVDAFESIDPGQPSYNYGLLLFLFYFEDIRPEVFSLFDVAAVVTTDTPIKGFPLVESHEFRGPRGPVDRLFLSRNPHRFPRVFLDGVDQPLETPSPQTDLGSAVLAAASPTQLEIEVQAAQSARLVVLETWYPGWRCWVNGEEAEVTRAGGAFRAVTVPGGSSLVRFEFESGTWRTGLALSFLGLFLGIVLIRLTISQHRSS